MPLGPHFSLESSAARVRSPNEKGVSLSEGKHSVVREIGNALMRWAAGGRLVAAGLIGSEEGGNYSALLMAIFLASGAVFSLRGMVMVSTPSLCDAVTASSLASSGRGRTRSKEPYVLSIR